MAAPTIQTAPDGSKYYITSTGRKVAVSSPQTAYNQPKDPVEEAINNGDIQALTSAWQTSRDPRVLEYFTKQYNDKQTSPEQIKMMIDNAEKTLSNPNLPKGQYDSQNAYVDILNQVYNTRTKGAYQEGQDLLNKLELDPKTMPGDLVRMRADVAGKANSPAMFNTASARNMLEDYIASLEDPFKQNMNTVMESMAARGLLDSGIQTENVGGLVNAYNQAKAMKGADIGGDIYNTEVSSADQAYNSAVENYINNLNEAFKQSGQTADEFYNERQAEIDENLKNFASNKGMAYDTASQGIQTNLDDYMSNLNDIGDVMGEIGGLAGSYFNSSGSSKNSNYNPYAGGYNPSNLDQYSKLDYSQYDPWANYKQSNPFYGNAFGG